ncbi:Fe2+/Zn2+ uptake regulation protein [Brevibacillus panacihumi W25]|uniref:Fe2+/Zn2+ uptake regulation protein n=1 Tax=Brevibacillus panacihumi W25 TaxID=1408254 RepID=V6M3X3_9BACL|nr:transcriptional repressor [Brevibacillus panacihumi]EST53326.1 Fe2+/Zn2+ uptake regulation protein [Brevibacillus panacihumi W25]
MEPQITSVTQQVKYLGKRLTVQRRAVLLHMLSTLDSPTAKDVYISLKREMPNITLSTVYTALRFFVKMGILKEHPAGHAATRFQCIIPRSAPMLKEVM